jgi:hypothetical protein
MVQANYFRNGLNYIDTIGRSTLSILLGQLLFWNFVSSFCIVDC